jgi:hypothetical protein
MGLEIHQMDVKTTFFNKKSAKEIYIEESDAFVQKNQDHFVCKLTKLFYKLKQSRRAWYKRIHIFFVNKGFTRSHADHLFYILQTLHCIVIVIIYVDDLIIL